MENYISNIWSAGEAGRLNFSPNASKNQKILIIGSGLTMLDAVTTLLNKGYEGQIIVISLDGKLPETHMPGVKTHPNFLDIHHPPIKILALLKKIREEIAEVAKNGGDWREVFDALRPVTIRTWMSLPLKEKYKVKRHLFGLWNRHRHRVPPEYLEKIKNLKAQGKFDLIQGTIQSVRPSSHDKLMVAYKEFSKGLKSFDADFVINCAGPNFNVLGSQSPLIRNLLKNSIIRSHPLNWGIAASSSFEVNGEGKGRIFAIGQILIGERFESIAVPELREQCAALAERLLHML